MEWTHLWVNQIKRQRAEKSHKKPNKQEAKKVSTDKKEADKSGKAKPNNRELYKFLFG